MPKTKPSGEPIQGELPSTLRKSSKKAQETFAKAHDNAAKEYGEGERAYRVAYSALKRTFEKRGDHWVPKQRSGSSDPRAASPRARENKGESFGGVDYHGSTKDELLRRARDLGVRGRSTMSKKELAKAIAREQS